MEDDQVQVLLDKQAILEVVLRYCRGWIASTCPSSGPATTPTA